uniref:Helicase ATP-binding domain-containing protein n=1 Tax=Romanomermis culicivorax TaxID=13658 RepID=A0A915K8H3_ROMCU
MIKPCVVYGGTSVRAQADRVRRGCNILVATPGRLKQFLNEGRIDLKKCRYFILDEADRMLDMGFEADVRTSNDRQTLMFSATFPREIQQLAREFLRNEHPFIAVGIVGAANSDIVQVIERVDIYDKKDRLVEMLQQDIDNCQPTA